MVETSRISLWTRAGGAVKVDPGVLQNPLASAGEEQVLPAFTTVLG